MIVTVAGRGLQFEWKGRPGREVVVVLKGHPPAEMKRLEKLWEGMKEKDLSWTDTALQTRASGDWPDTGSHDLVMWSADFPDWRGAALFFGLLGRSCGLEHEEAWPDIEVEPGKGGEASWWRSAPA